MIDEVSGPADLHPQSRYLQLYHDALEAFHRRDFAPGLELFSLRGFDGFTDSLRADYGSQSLCESMAPQVLSKHERHANLAAGPFESH